ncbi:hypothetical protein BC833DRAFT_607866 [Globomyces pollinis-pini]|nr:hypothetical protein BC833DRAFT_607866 [Globomyces pollinis-pini]
MTDFHPLKGSQCNQCDKKLLNQFEYISINYKDGRIDCFCGEEGKKVIECGGQAPNINFPYMGHDCQIGIRINEELWTNCIYKQPRELIDRVGFHLYTCAIKVNATITPFKTSRIVTASVQSNQQNSTPGGFDLSLYLYIVIPIAVLLVLGVLCLWWYRSSPTKIKSELDIPKLDLDKIDLLQRDIPILPVIEITSPNSA